MIHRLHQFTSLLCVLLIATAGFVQCAPTDRQPAVAGQFYPADRNELTTMLGQLFAKASAPKKFLGVVAIISPHAGYVYSGSVAASSFNQIDPTKQYENVFVIGPSHHVGFEGAAVYTEGNFITPLGTVKVNTTLGKQLVAKFDCFSDRIDAHAAEHSVEVQIPFLQYRLKKPFELVPIVVGSNSPSTCRKIADALRPFLTTKNLFVISTDFSHYPPYDDAVRIDRITTDAVLSNSSAKLIETITANDNARIPNLATSMCGWAGVLTLLDMTEGNPDIRMNFVEYKNSGDAAVGDRSRVVGYTAIAVSLKTKREKVEFELNSEDKRALLAIARSTVERYVAKNDMPPIDTARLSPTVKRNCGAFVTLHKHGELRGCIGRFDANEPLYKVVQQMAVAASTQDYRFPSVNPDEVKNLEIEISVLTPMQPISSIDEIQLGKHGIYIRKDGRSGTFLPQVATETGWSKEEFLGHCAQDKAGLGWDGWKDAELFVYEAKVFSEAELGLK